MRTRYQVNTVGSAHFVTSTIVNWLPIFTTAARCDILANALAYCQSHKGLQIHAWVILDNHFHAILNADDLPRMMADLKRHTAKRLVEQLAREGVKWITDALAYYRRQHKVESTHQVWEEGYHPQAIFDDAMMEQKLDYIHRNPVERGLVALPEHWRYSSAHEWLTGGLPIFRCTPWRS
jgi:putative transposase